MSDELEQLNIFGDVAKEEKVAKSENENNAEYAQDKEEIKRLRKEIKHHSDLYYNQDAPEISDFEYDNLMKRLKELEKKHPELITKSSPTQIVGGTASKGFDEVEHEVHMQSLNDVFSYAEVEDFVKSVEEEFEENVEFVVETKIDGLSVSLEYVEGNLVRGSTRGNGIVGENITENVKQIVDIPVTLNTKDTIEVRGEVYLSRKNLELLNDELMSEGKPMLANCRNAAAGTLRQLNTELVKKRGLSIFVFNVQKSERKFDTHSESIEYCKNAGMTTIAYSKVAVGIKEVLACIEEIGEMREGLAYDIDGAVVKVNDLSLRDTLGVTTKVPKWAVAYKYPPEEKETVVQEIRVQVGRTGKITPLAVITPVKVAGSVISKSTLHNFDYIAALDIRVGDTVKIRKAGDVIPEVFEVVKEKRKSDSQPYTVPTVCPVCGELLEKEEDTVDLRCTNSECEAQSFRAIVHFASRECMDIDGLGEATVEQLVDRKLVKTVADIYAISKRDAYKLEGFKEKSAQNLIDAIEKSKSNSLDKLLFGLGIRHIGKKAAKIIAENVDSIYDLYNMSEEDLLKLSDVGPKMAESIVTFFAKEKTREIIDMLDKAGVNLKGIKKELVSHALEGLSIAVTGSFDNISRTDITKLIEENAGKATTSVSKKTDILIAGASAGSKLTKAHELNVEVLTIEEFRNRFMV